MNHFTCAPHARQLSPIDVIEQFRAALIAADIVPPATILADGVMHRCDTAAANGKKDATYLLHVDNPPMGGFQNYQDGVGWRPWKPSGIVLPANIAALHAVAAAREREREILRKASTERARWIWNEATPAPADHGYLTRKQISPGELRVWKDKLVVPAISSLGLQAVQLIADDGEKRFLKHSPFHGCYSPIGRVDPSRPIILICEGYSTGSTLHDATGWPVACAFNGYNMRAVAMAMRRKRPLSALIICGDDDHATRGNPGRTAAQAAALAASGSLVMPRWPDGPQLGMTDFNDLAVEHGMDAVKACFDA